MTTYSGIMRYPDGKKEKYQIGKCNSWYEAWNALMELKPRVALVVVEGGKGKLDVVEPIRA